MQEQLDRIEKKLDKLLKLMNPIVAIDKALRADILKELIHGKLPRKQPKPDAWLGKVKKIDKSLNENAEIIARITEFEKDDVA